MKNLFIIFTLLLMLSCVKDGERELCFTEKPFEKIEWLKELKDNYDADNQKQQIFQYEFNGNSIFLIVNCYQCPDALSMVVDCNNKKICEYGGIDGRNTCSEFENDFINKRIIYNQ